MNFTIYKSQKEEKYIKEGETFMFCESVNIMVRRSIPNPQPPVGGNPYSRAVQNVSSKAMASSSPDCRSLKQCHGKIIRKKNDV